MRSIGSRVLEHIDKACPATPHRSIAADIGMTPDAFSRAVNDRRAFSSIELARLADRLNADVHWLITGQPDPHRLVGYPTRGRTRSPCAWTRPPGVGFLCRSRMRISGGSRPGPLERERSPECSASNPKHWKSTPPRFLKRISMISLRCWRVVRTWHLLKIAVRAGLVDADTLWGYIQTLRANRRGGPPGVNDRPSFGKWLTI